MLTRIEAAPEVLHGEIGLQPGVGLKVFETSCSNAVEEVGDISLPSGAMQPRPQRHVLQYVSDYSQEMREYNEKGRPLWSSLWRAENET